MWRLTAVNEYRVHRRVLSIVALTMVCGAQLWCFKNSSLSRWCLTLDIFVENWEFWVLQRPKCLTVVKIESLNRRMTVFQCSCSRLKNNLAVGRFPILFLPVSFFHFFIFSIFFIFSSFHHFLYFHSISSVIKDHFIQVRIINITRFLNSPQAFKV